MRPSLGARGARRGLSLGLLLGAAAAGLALLLLRAPGGAGAPLPGVNPAGARSRAPAEPGAPAREQVAPPAPEQVAPHALRPASSAGLPPERSAVRSATPAEPEPLLQHSLRYRVVNELGQPVVGAQTSVDTTPGRRGGTDAEGRGVLDGLTAPTGVLLVHAWRRGRARVSFDLGDLGERGLSPRPERSTRSSELLVRLTSPPGLFVRVIDARGDPAAGLEVALSTDLDAGPTIAFSRQGGPGSSHGKTDALGRVSLALPAAYPPPTEPELEVVVRDATGGELLAEPFSWAPGVAVHLDLVVPEPSRLAGRVTGADGRPLELACVRVGEAAFLSGADGGFSTYGVRVPRADVLVTAPGHAPRLLLGLSLAPPTAPLDVSLERGRTLRIREVRAEGSRSPELELVARWRGFAVGRARRDRGHGWILEGLPFEPLRLELRAEWPAAPPTELELPVAADEVLLELPRWPAPEPVPFPPSAEVPWPRSAADGGTSR